MSILTIPYTPQPGDPEDITLLNANYAQIAAVINGLLEAQTNVKVASAISLPGDSNQAGSSLNLARSDHTHIVQGVERGTADPTTGNFVGRLFFRTDTLQLRLCISSAGSGTWITGANLAATDLPLHASRHAAGGADPLTITASMLAMPERGSDDLKDRLWTLAGATPGIRGRNFDPLLGGQQALTNNRLQYVAVAWPGGTMTGFARITTAAIVGGSGNTSAAGLFGDTTSTPIAGTTTTMQRITAPSGALTWAATGMVKTAWAAPFPQTMPAGVYYVALLASYSTPPTTMPNLLMQPGTASGTGAAASAPGDLTPASLPLSAYLASQTAVPTSQAISALNATGDNVPWIGLY